MNKLFFLALLTPLIINCAESKLIPNFSESTLSEFKQMSSKIRNPTFTQLLKKEFINEEKVQKKAGSFLTHLEKEMQSYSKKGNGCADPENLLFIKLKHEASITSPGYINESSSEPWSTSKLLNMLNALSIKQKIEENSNEEISIQAFLIVYFHEKNQLNIDYTSQETCFII